MIRHFQERMPCGLFVPDVPSEQAKPDAVTSSASASCGHAVALARGSNVPQAVMLSSVHRVVDVA